MSHFASTVKRGVDKQKVKQGEHKLSHVEEKHNVIKRLL
jgi:hypothetical protein